MARIISRCSVSKSTSACLSNSAFSAASSPRAASSSPAASHSSSRSVERSALVQFRWSSTPSNARIHCLRPAISSPCSGSSTWACACRYAAMCSCHAASVCRACSICRMNVLNRFCGGVNAGPALPDEICRALMCDMGQLELRWPAIVVHRPASIPPAQAHASKPRSHRRIEADLHRRQHLSPQRRFSDLKNDAARQCLQLNCEALWTARTFSVSIVKLSATSVRRPQTQECSPALRQVADDAREGLARTELTQCLDLSGGTDCLQQIGQKIPSPHRLLSDERTELPG